MDKFIQTNNIEEIENYLMDDNMVFSFIGNSFRFISYKPERKIVIIKSYDIVDQIQEQVDECSISRFIDWAKENIKDDNCYYMLYHGDLNTEDKIYKVIREFYSSKAKEYMKIA